MSEQQFYERELTRLEIQQRKDLALDMMVERDDLVSAVDEKKREIKEIHVDLARLDARIAQLRREARIGKVFEPRQVTLGFGDAHASVRPLNTDGPTLGDADGNPVEDPRDAEEQVLDDIEAPELGAETQVLQAQPAGDDTYDRFYELYPMARNHGALRDYLHEALTGEQYARLETGTVEAWKIGSPAFDLVAHWARVEKSHRDAPHRGPIPGLTTPRKLPMPEQLAELLGDRGKKSRKPRGGAKA